jgi:hypothetical protein
MAAQPAQIEGETVQSAFSPLTIPNVPVFTQFSPIQPQ